MAYTDKFPLLANFVETTLAAPCEGTDTVIYLADVTKFPAVLNGRDYIPCVLRDAGDVREIIYVTAVNSSGKTITCQRGQEGTTARAWARGAYCYCTLTAYSAQRLRVNSFTPLLSSEGSRPEITRADSTSCMIAGNVTDDIEIGMAVRIISGGSAVAPVNGKNGGIYVTSCVYSGGKTTVGFQNVSLPAAICGIDLGISTAAAPLFHPDTLPLSDAVDSPRSDIAASSNAVKKACDKAVGAASTVMTGATESADGKAGRVPAPAKGAQHKPLRGDGTFGDFLECNITGTASANLPSSGGTVSGGIYPEVPQIPLGDARRFWNIFAKYIEFITEAGVSAGSINAFEYDGAHILGLYPNTEKKAQIHLGSEERPLEKIQVNRLNGCWGGSGNVSAEKPAAVTVYGTWSDSYSGGWYVRLSCGIQIIAVCYVNGSKGQDVWIPFPVPFRDTSYAPVCMPLAVNSNTMANAGVTSRQTTGCVFASQFGAGVYKLPVCGIFMGWF